MVRFFSTCRSDNLQLIQKILTPNNFNPYKSINIVGPQGCGKSSTIAHIINEHSPTTKYVDCAHCYNEHILWSALCGIYNTSGDTVGEFIRALRNVGEHGTLVFDSAEKLSCNIITILNKLNDYSPEIDICCVFISDKVCSTSSLLIHIPHYTIDEIKSILLLHLSPTSQTELFVDIIASVVDGWTFNLHEIIPTAKKYFQLVPNKMTTHSMWKVLQSSLVLAPQFIFLRTDLPTEYLNLPTNSKLVLICAYIASYNPTGTDLQYFMKNTKKSRPKNRTHQMVGPKLFELDRLCAIHHVVRQQLTTPLYEINSHLSTLVYLKLLYSTAGLDSPKFRCLISYEQVLQVAKSISLNLRAYLYDLN